MLKDILTIIEKVYSLSRTGNHLDGLSILDKAIQKYPGSTELLVLRTEELQLTDVDNLYDLHKDIENPLEDAVKLNPMNFDALIELIAFEHLVLDDTEKAGPLFENGIDSLNETLENFLPLYFSYLSEMGRESDIQKTKELLKATIENIQEKGS